MAESSETRSSNNADIDATWWGSWMQTAKDKSAVALEFMKKDLTEFATTVQNESSKAVEATSHAIQNTLKSENTAAATSKVKQGVTNFLLNVSKALTVPPDDSDEEVVRISSHQQGHIYDRAKARLHAIQIDPGTYLSYPSGSPESYQLWREGLNLEERKGYISELLVSKAEVRALYTKLVPLTLSHADFWDRYFYKVHQLQLEEARKQALIKRAEQKKDDSINWDEEAISDTEENRMIQDRLHGIGHSTARIGDPSGEHAVVTLEPYHSGVESLQNPLEYDERCETGSCHHTDKPGGTDFEKETQSLDKYNVIDDKMDQINVVKLSEDSASLSSQSEERESDDLVAFKLDTDSDSNGLVHVRETHSCKDNKGNSTKTVVQELPNTGVSKQVPVSISPSADSEIEQTFASDQSVPGQSTKEKLDVSAGVEHTELKTRQKGDMVVVGSGSASTVSSVSPVSETSEEKKGGTASSGGDVDEDWEGAFDVEVTEEDMKAAEEVAKKLAAAGISTEITDDDDWNWD